MPAGDPEYFPRSILSVAPRPLASVDVPFPEDVDGVVDLRVQVTLLIDAAGTVRGIRFDSGGVPPGFARAIEETFLAAQFSPGELQGRAVPSAIRLEVAFSSDTAR
jgi:hypothetical protein